MTAAAPQAGVSPHQSRLSAWLMPALAIVMVLFVATMKRKAAEKHGTRADRVEKAVATAAGNELAALNDGADALRRVGEKLDRVEKALSGMAEKDRERFDLAVFAALHELRRLDGRLDAIEKALEPAKEPEPPDERYATICQLLGAGADATNLTLRQIYEERK